jgi:hypothetical protein
MEEHFLCEIEKTGVLCCTEVVQANFFAEAFFIQFEQHLKSNKQKVEDEVKKTKKSKFAVHTRGQP